MKKLFLVLLVLAVSVVLLSSCERRCICKYDDGSEEVIYSAYSKKDCNDWDKYLNDDLNMKTDCTYKRIN